MKPKSMSAAAARIKVLKLKPGIKKKGRIKDKE